MNWKVVGLGASLAVLMSGSTLQARVADGVSVASPADVVTVTTADDVVNGDVSSPAALMAHPGPDGVSLREAITAVNAVSGAHAITFAPSLAGRTISPVGFLPAFERADTALVGLTGADGQPTVTLDASGNTNGCCSGLLGVYASGVTISHLRFTGVRGHEIAVVVRGGDPGEAQQIEGVQIQDNVFDGDGQGDVALLIGTDFPGDLKRCPACGLFSGAVGATVSNVIVSGNVFRGWPLDAIDVDLNGSHCTVQDPLFADNSFVGGQGGISVFPERSDNRVVGTQILRNDFSGTRLGVVLGTITEGGKFAGSGNRISGSVISQNAFSGTTDSAISLTVDAQGGTTTGNAISDTEISNNLIAGGGNGISLAASLGAGATGNAVDGVRIVNDTIASTAVGLSMRGTGDGNSISNVDVRNVILWSNGADFGGEDVFSDPPTVRASITTSPAFASGNIDADPRFVSAQDFHLQAGSPAIDAGTRDGAPAVDIDDRLRDALPDIGAYESGAAARPRLTVAYLPFAGAGTVTSSPAGIACPGTCSSSFPQGTSVTLTATPDASSSITWSGLCAGSGPCNLTMDSAQSVTAAFTRLTYRLTVDISGRGNVKSNPAGISCPGTCSLDIGKGDPPATLTASPTPGYRFTGWTGACTGKGACAPALTTDTRVNATFVRNSPMCRKHQRSTKQHPCRRR